MFRSIFKHCSCFQLETNLTVATLVTLSIFFCENGIRFQLPFETLIKS